jgi:hypothetical protein
MRQDIIVHHRFDLRAFRVPDLGRADRTRGKRGAGGAHKKSGDADHDGVSPGECLGHLGHSVRRDQRFFFFDMAASDTIAIS